MKGILHKKINGTWVVRLQSKEQHNCSSVIEHGQELTIHPDYIKYYFLDEDAEGGEVEFEIVRYCKKHNSDPSKNSVCTLDCGYDEVSYAKLINQVRNLGNDEVMTDSPMVKRLKEHLNSITPEQFQQEIKEINDELEMENDVLKLGNEDVRKLGYDVKEHEILKEMRTMSAKHGFEEHSFFTRETQNQKRLSFYFGAKWGYEKAKETLYTEEQLRAAMKYASEITNKKMKYMENYIQSLKQNKKD